MINEGFDLSKYQIENKQVSRNPPIVVLYNDATQFDTDSVISSTNALIAYSGSKTGRCPKDKKIVDDPTSNKNINWGDVNVKMSPELFETNLKQAKDFLNSAQQLYVIDGWAGWDPAYQIKIRVICSRAYHALFMHNMLIRPTAEQLINFGEPDYIIYNAGQQESATSDSKISINLSFEKKAIILLGTEYAGEMKKGVFTIMNYLLPLKNVFPMHCSANEGIQKDVSLFFGLSGTGKTTLSANVNRKLIGDDEHGWSENGVFNIEGGCYAKTVNLSQEKEPEIFNAIKWGSVLENVKYNPINFEVDYDDISITENTRASYPIESIKNVKIPCVGAHPNHIIFLTCDAFGVLPPVSKLNAEQAMYHFMSGYTAKVAGTEMGITEPKTTFSACFGAAFMVWHPSVYAHLLAEKIEKHQTKVWLVNTGWIGGGVEEGHRISLKYTRAIIDAIQSNYFDTADFYEEEGFRFQVPLSCPGVDATILNPKKHWNDKNKFELQKNKLISLFNTNFLKFKDQCSDKIIQAGPQIKYD